VSVQGGEESGQLGNLEVGIWELTKYSPEAFADIAVLMGQLSDRCGFTEEKLKEMVEDVVIREEYRGQHLWRQLMESVLEQARGSAPIEIHLTSNPKRVADSERYGRMGFERREDELL